MAAEITGYTTKELLEKGIADLYILKKSRMLWGI
jgi:hypothetical protein